MNKTATFFGNFGDLCQSLARRIVNTGRQYQLIPALYLVGFVFAQVQYANRQVSLPVAPEPGNTPNTAPTAATVPTAPTATAIAAAKVYRNGNSLVIKWDRPVINQKIADESSLPLAASCQPQVCTVQLVNKTDNINVAWTSGTETFTTKFKL